MEGDSVINYWTKKIQGSWENPENSLEFLIDDLEKNVEKNGRPVVLFRLYGWVEWGKSWWSDKEREIYYNAVKEYNVIGIFYGHSHEIQSDRWNGIDIWCVGAAQKDPDPGEFVVVHISRDEMVVAHRLRDRWGDVWKKSVKQKID